MVKGYSSCLPSPKVRMRRRSSAAPTAAAASGATSGPTAKSKRQHIKYSISGRRLRKNS